MKDAETKVTSTGSDHCEDLGGRPNDVLTLNVGGSLITTFRRTLTSVPGSLLEAKFSGRWDESLERDQNGNIFVDQSIDIFLPLINFFRRQACQVPTSPPLLAPGLSTFKGNKQQYEDFLVMIDYYGLTSALYPVEPIVFDSKSIEANKGSVEIKQLGHGQWEVNAKEWTMIRLLTLGHVRRVRSFQVLYSSVNDNDPNGSGRDDCNPAIQVGWLEVDAKASDFSLHGWAWDSQQGGITRYGKVKCALLPSQDENTTFQPLSISCDKESRSWCLNDKVRGELAAFSIRQDSVPAIAGQGRFIISHLVLDHGN